MNLEQSRSSWFKVPLLGFLALAALAICTGSGIVLALAYRPDAALDSLALLMMKNPAGVFFRSAHYWSAQGFLVLSLLHVLDHLLKRSETVVETGVWLRLTLAVPVILYAMLSGFLLRADAASMQAGQIFRGLLQAVPWMGSSLSWALTGQDQGLFVVFLHHVCTATLLLWLVTFDHAGRILPGRSPMVWVLAPVVLAALLLVPGLESGRVAVEKGPWYLAGLQELLHWLPEPKCLVWLALLALAMLALLPALPPVVRTALKRTMAPGLVVYAVVSIIALAFRGEGWRLGWTGTVSSGTFHSIKAYASPPPSLLKTSVPNVNGEREGCLSCHDAMTGFAPAHDPKRIGCAACHLGERFTLNKELAHAGMTLTPGNLSIVRQTCASANCHSEMESRLRASLMTTMSGVVAVDKFVFGESKDLNHQFDVSQLQHSPADTHLRELCASCHLGQDKAEPAAIDELSRGGGCSACHLDYGDKARAELGHRNAHQANRQPLQHHPDISATVGQQACFGCHSRSGRISLNYEGWHETLLEDAAVKRKADWQQQYRVLADGRVLERHEADVHFEKGMECVDCHLAAEVMGDGHRPAHKENAIKIACADCHTTQKPAVKPLEQLDPETQKLAALLKLNEPERRFVLASSRLAAYPNVYLGDDGQPVLKTKRLGKVLIPKAPSAACGRDITGHRQLECRACHSAWAPQCITCHTSFEPSSQGWDHLAGRMVTGAWQEQSDNFLAEAPALGVEEITSAEGASQRRFTTFVPGMILTLKPRTGGTARSDEFHRLYAPISAHTIVSKARDCRSCHVNPVALGYGRGKLTYEIKDRSGFWKFEPSSPPQSRDGLPPDAWVGFLQEPGRAATTRRNCRPLDLQEQQRILLVGACLQCHTEKEPRLRATFSDFEHYRTLISRQCCLPTWPRSSLSRRAREAITDQAAGDALALEKRRHLSDGYQQTSQAAVRP